VAYLFRTSIGGTVPMFIVKQVISSQATLAGSLGKLLDRRFARGAFAGKPARSKMLADVPVVGMWARRRPRRQ
jgi:hypothetical protein